MCTSLGYVHHLLTHSRAAQDAPVKTFLSTISGRAISQDEPLTIQQQSYINYVEQEIDRFPVNMFAEILHEGNQPNSDSIDHNEVFVLLKCLAKSAQVGRGFSIDAALQQAINDNIICRDALKAPLRNQALTILFSCVAWISMLYPPVRSSPPNFETISIDRNQCICILDSQPVSNTNRPLCEVIQDFGPLLPIRRESVVPNTSDSIFSAESLYVSLLNASTLIQIGGVEIEWVSDVSSHLSFDPEKPKLLRSARSVRIRAHRLQSKAGPRIREKTLTKYQDRE